MPKNKDLKRLTRSRMQKTGESYTTARAQLADKKKRRENSSPANYAELAGMSDEAVKKATGAAWRRWVSRLDEIEATSMPHREIARHVYDNWEISGWWAQTVTVGYERIRGLREIGQRRAGTYEVNKSKTLPVPIDKLYRAFSVARTRNRWLPGVELKVRKSTPEKSMRVTWEDGTAVEVYFYAKGKEKSQVAIQHRKLASKADAERMKAYWGERLGALAEVLSPKT